MTIHGGPRRRDDQPTADGAQRRRARRYGGFTLIEILIVVVIIGVLSTTVVFAVRGVVDRGEEASCETGAKITGEAVEAYFAENRVDMIPATGPAADSQRFERTLVESGRLDAFSALHDVNADGTLTVVSTQCIP